MTLQTPPLVARQTRAAVLQDAGLPRLLHLEGGAGPMWGYLMGLGRSELQELETQLAAAHVRQRAVLQGSRTCDAYSLSSLGGLVTRYNASATQAGYTNMRVSGINVVTALPVASHSEDDSSQEWHTDNDAGVRVDITVCVALTPVTTRDGPMQYELGQSGQVEFEATGPAGTHWMFLQQGVRHRGSPNVGASPRRVLMIDLARVV